MRFEAKWFGQAIRDFNRQMSNEYEGYLVHPRFGQGPRITGLNPENDFASGVFLLWHSSEGVRIPNTAIPADVARQLPGTMHVTHYFDAKRQCADCGGRFIFFATEQKHWYEELGFSLNSDLTRCIECRKRRRGLDLKRQRYEELFHVQQRTLEENLELADCLLSLVEAGVFGKRQIERVRGILRKTPTGAEQRAFWARVRVLERAE